MKRLLLSAFILLAALSTIPAAQMRVVPLDEEQGHVALGLALRHLAQHRHLHAHHGAPRRREQRAARDAEPRPGLPHRARDGDARQRRPERNRPRDLRGARRAADRRARGAAPLRRRRAVLHARRRFRLLVRDRRDVREVGPRRNHCRLCAADPHDPSGRHHHPAADRQRRRPAPHGVGGDHARRLQARRRSDEVSRADQGRAAPVAAEEAVSQRRLRLPRRAAAARQGDARQLRRLRRAARQDLQRDRQRGAQHAQVPGHGAAARRCPRRRRTPPTSWSRRRLPAQMQKDETSLFDGVDSSDPRPGEVRRRASRRRISPRV